MTIHECDILVVGAGPAGSSAAMAAAERGMKVLVAERRETVGMPVRCAEYIPGQLLGLVNLGRSFVVQAVRGMKTILPGGVVKETVAPGFTIYRDLFDQTLARGAEEAGAEIRTGFRVTGRDGGFVHAREAGGRVCRVRARVIIGADGPRSTVGGWIDSVNRNLIPGIQVSVPLTGAQECTHVYFHRDIYGGYGWLFPKGDEANVGLGMKPRQGVDPSLRVVLRSFVERLAGSGTIVDRPRRWVAGWIPAESVRRVTAGNVMLAGDAAGHTHPITGAGVAQAVICGRMAGAWAARAVETGRSEECAAGYEEEWRDTFGETQERAYARRQVLERDWDRLDEIVRSCWVAFREYYGRS